LEIAADSVDFVFGFSNRSVIPEVVVRVLVPGENDVREVLVVVGEPHDEPHGVVGNMVMFDAPQVVIMASLTKGHQRAGEGSAG
jgi:hypothetical protein